ncbi:hypothetical protein ULF88_00200 [Halopseudomonas pachastrellae]|nr:hypothetical protein [Halopseudomonas pachastrellae]
MSDDDSLERALRAMLQDDTDNHAGRSDDQRLDSVLHRAHFARRCRRPAGVVQSLGLGAV